jgi:DNA polymerase-3 subunit alpha
MTGEKFVHLHNHTYYSLLDGLSSPKQMAREAKSKGFKSLAITDHGTCSGWLNFQRACRAEGIKPILGSELYITENMRERDKNETRHHITVLAKNEKGLQNLMHLSTMAETKGKYYKPRVDFDLLSQYSEGLVVSSGCPASELSYAIADDDMEKSKDVIGRYKDVFGDDYYLEIMTHQYLNNDTQQNAEKKLARTAFQLSRKFGVKAICTNDAHYASKNDAEFHDVLLCVQTKGNINNPKRFSFKSDEFYLKSYDEMLRIYKSAPELLTNTVEISEKIADEDLLKFVPDLLPNFNVPEGYKDELHYLKTLIKEGMMARGFMNKAEYRERIKFEMGVISRCGYVKYFLILWDIMNFAKQTGIRVGIGRGSAVGSLALYVLGITKIDPLKYDLLFERFLNPERVSPPDVDVDFDYYRRGEIYDYIYRKYGQDHCCKIGTYNSLQSKAVVRYCAKALDIGNDWKSHERLKAAYPEKRIEMPKNSLNLADQISKQIPVGQNVDTSIEAQLKNNHDFRNMIARYPRLVGSVRHLEGVLSSAGVHPAGIVICKDRIDKYIPLRDSKGQVCSQFDGPEVEDLGLLKFDLLALKTLTVVDNTLKLIKERHGVDIDIDNLEPNDQKIFDMLNGKMKGVDNRGVFQFESDGISKLLKSIKVDTFEDMVVANALYRPGPLGAKMHEMYADYKHGRKPINPLHPKMKEILKDTFSIMVYQENVMKIAQELAGFTKGQSDALRKAVGKQKMELLEEQKILFVDGCNKNGIKEEIAKKIFEQIEFFGGYGFNKSHSCAYAFLAYQCCYLKVYYPIEFMTSLLSSEIDNNDKNLKLRGYVNQAERVGIVVKITNINTSGVKFRIESGSRKDSGKDYDFIRPPITMLDGIGAKAAESIVDNQPYNCMEDFLKRVDTSKVSSKVFTALVNAGSMDVWKRDPNVGVAAFRNHMLNSYDDVKKKVVKEKNEIKKQTKFKEQYSGSLFDSFGSVDI